MDLILYNASEQMSFQEKLRLEDQIQILQAQLRKSETEKYELSRKLNEEKVTLNNNNIIKKYFTNISPISGVK